MVLPTVLSMFRYVSGQSERDFVDRLHCVFTSNILIGLAILVSFKYAEMFCFTQDTYYVPMSEVVDAMPRIQREQRRISYYQWVPFFLIIQAACFRVPSLLWKYVSDYSGIKVKEVLRMALDENNVKPDIKQANIKALANHLQGALRFHRRLMRNHLRPHRFFCLFNLPYSTCYVTSMFLMNRFLCMANVFAQLYAMNMFLSTNRYQLYGFGAILDVIRGRNWEKSGLFPRSTLCDFNVRVMGNIQEHTIQCVLLINLLNEKIFVFLWFWYVFLLALTTASFLFWLWTLLLPCVNKQFIHRHLDMVDMPVVDAYDYENSVSRFMKNYLRTDGVFVIRTVVFQAGVIFGTELLAEIWRSYVGIEEQLRKESMVSPMMSMAMEDQTEYENRRNYLRQRRQNRMAESRNHLSAIDLYPPTTTYRQPSIISEYPPEKMPLTNQNTSVHYAEHLLKPPDPYGTMQRPRPNSNAYELATPPPPQVIRAYAENQKIIEDFHRQRANHVAQKPSIDRPNGVNLEEQHCKAPKNVDKPRQPVDSESSM